MKALRAFRNAFSAYRVDIVVILTLGLAMMLLWLWSSHTQYNQDSTQYLRNARYLAGHPDTSYTFERTPGYSLFLVLTGVTRYDTFRGLVAFQAVLGLAIPLLIYFTLLPIHRRLAQATAIISIIVPIPFIYSNMVMTEQLSLFLQFLFVFLASRYLAAARPPICLYLGTLTAFAMAFTRPATGLSFWVFLPVAILASPRRLREPLLAAVLYCTLLLAWSGMAWLFVGHGDKHPPNLLTVYGKQWRFAEAYFTTWLKNFENYEKQRPFLTKSQGPASRELYDRISRIVRESPGAWVWRPPHSWFGAYAEKREELLREVFLRPRAEYFIFIVDALSVELGEKGTADLLTSVAREHGRTGLRGLGANLSLGVSTYLGGPSLFWEAYVAGRHHGAYDYDHPFRLIRYENGPATRQLYEAVDVFGKSEGWGEVSPSRNILDRNEADSYGGLWSIVGRLYGPAAADRLLRDVALEAFRAYPKSILLFWDNFVMLAAGPNDVPYGIAKRNTDLAGVLYLSSDLDKLPAKMRAEVAGEKPAVPFFDFLYRLAAILKPFILVLSLVFLSFAWAAPSRPLFSLLMLLSLSQYALVSVLSQPHQRLSDPVYLLIVMAAGIGISSALRGSGCKPIEAGGLRGDEGVHRTSPPGETPCAEGRFML